MILKNNNPQKKILFISYHFPPSAAVGGQRIKGFVKYLINHNWKPSVLTLDEKYIEKKDISSLLNLQHTEIVRTKLLPSFRDFYLFIKKIIKKKSVVEQTSYLDNPLSEKQHETNINQTSEKLILKFKRYFISLFVTLPDQERNWVPITCIAAYKEIKREKIKVIFTSGPPHSVHLIGLFLKTFSKVRWVADFRDPWMTPFNKRLYLTCRLSNTIERWLEGKIFKKSDLVLTTTEMLQGKIKETYQTIPQDKIRFLPNGFDSEDFLFLKNTEKYETFTISYTGSIYFSRSPKPLFRAVKELIDEDRLNLFDVRIKLVGNCQYIGEELTSSVVNSYGLDEVVEISDMVPYEESLEIIKKSHIALLLATKQPYQIPAKVYDYMGTGSNILALTDRGATADLIDSTCIGIAISPDDIEGIKEYVLKTISEGNSSCNYKKKNSEYVRSNIVEGFAHALDRIL